MSVANKVENLSKKYIIRHEKKSARQMQKQQRIISKWEIDCLYQQTIYG